MIRLNGSCITKGEISQLTSCYKSSSLSSQTTPTKIQLHVLCRYDMYAARVPRLA